MKRTGSLGSFIRSAARATSSAPRRLPIRWRLAGASALLTLTILLAFAIAVGTLTARRIRSDFDQQVRSTADELHDRIQVRAGQAPACVGDLDFIAAEHAHVRVLTPAGDLICQTKRAPDLGFPGHEAHNSHGYRVEARRLPIVEYYQVDDQRHRRTIGYAVMQYARPVAGIEHTIDKVQLFLVLGVLGGVALALLAGLTISRRAMAPVAALTSAAREIERTRDPSRRVPRSPADDEVAELARTLQGMLEALDDSRTRTERALTRQREFVADASHELRTPLTSVLANLEILAERLAGDDAETADSALRSARRMRRLVGDLLLLARADAKRASVHGPTDLADVLVEAASELEPVAEDHRLSVDVRPAIVDGNRDDLHRLAANLLENALRHTAPGTHVRASVVPDGDSVELVVEDDGPGVPPELAPRIFDRFVRGQGERAGSAGLGLAIVKAVADSHGGDVRLERNGGRGARFVVTLPLARVPVEA